MRKNLTAALLAATLVVTGTLLADTPATGTAAKPQTFGKPLAGLALTPLADLFKTPDAFQGKTVRTEGKVAAVCQEKGCWMTMGDGEKTMRIRFEGYSFFVPKNCAGMTATVEGVFKVQTIPEATAKHYAEETPGGDPGKIKGDQKEISFTATGVELRK
jgi:hypothetical protein